MTKEKFYSLKNEWREATIFHSNLLTIYGHPAYQEIVAAGKVVIPFILEDLRDNGPEHWWDALEELTGVNCVVSDEVANGWRGIHVRETCDKWVKWGQENGYIT